MYSQLLPGRVLASLGAAFVMAGVLAGVPGAEASGAVSVNSSLVDVTATSASNAWAVGTYSDGTANLTLIEHWNGKSWKQVPSPSPSCIPGDELFSVAATSATSAWAVGEITNCFSLTPVTLIERWNGRSWKAVASPNPGGFQGNHLLGVAATSARNAWAVGSYSDGTVGHTLIERWNGRSWKHAASPDVDGSARDNTLSGVAATSATGAWAVGNAISTSVPVTAVTVIERWNGKSWKHVASPNPGDAHLDNLIRVAATSATNAWAVGGYIKGSSELTLIEHWNGKSWKQVPSPSPAGAFRERQHQAGGHQRPGGWFLCSLCLAAPET